VHCLVGRGAWWQQAVSQQPLLLLQVLLTVADVSPGHQGKESIHYSSQHRVELHAPPPPWDTPLLLPGLELPFHSPEVTVPCMFNARRYSLTSQSTC
jgi:hypothetical protein